MEDYIQISKINDFIFSPKSIYYHSIYEGFDESLYHDTPQVVGRFAHERIDNVKYSTKKEVLQGIMVSNEKLRLIGKIDIFDQNKKELIERKYYIKKIYDGYKYQLYAQYLCLKEMGFIVEKLFLYSVKDNKKYQVSIPNKKEMWQFLQIIEKIRNYNVLNDNSAIVSSKLENCIYKELFY